LSLARDSMTACRQAPAGRAMYYSAIVPPGQRLSAHAQPTTFSGVPWYPVIQVLGACGASTCLAESSIGFPAGVQFVNRTSAAQTVILAVGSNLVQGAGTFALS